MPWGDVRDLKNTTWNVFVLHCSDEQQLLFINSSDCATVHEELARAVCGAGYDAHSRRANTLHGVTRFIIQDLELWNVISRAVQFSMHSGSDVDTALSNAMRQNPAQSNLFGRGYECGDRVTVGCSQKGPRRSHRVVCDLEKWVKWCHKVDAKLANQNISTDSGLEARSLADESASPLARRSFSALLMQQKPW